MRFLPFLLFFARTVHSIDYRVEVKTGDASLAGTDAVVRLGLTGSQGHIPPTLLDNANNDFERNSLDTYILSSKDAIGRVCGVNLQKQGGGLTHQWLVDYVTVFDPVLNEKRKFTYNRWISEDNVIYGQTLVVNGGWSRWGNWSTCTVCGTTTERRRKCDSPSPSCGGAACQGKAIDKVACPADDCIISATKSPLSSASTSFALTSVTVTSQTTSTARSQPMNNENNLALPIGASLGAAAVVLIIVIVVVCCISRRRHKSRAYNGPASPDIPHRNGMFDELTLSELRYADVPDMSEANHASVVQETPRIAPVKTPSQALTESDYYNDEIANGRGQSRSKHDSNFYENTDDLQTHLTGKTPPKPRPSSEYVYATPGNIDGVRLTHDVPNNYYGYVEVCNDAGKPVVASKPTVPHYFDMSGRASDSQNATPPGTSSVTPPLTPPRPQSARSTWLENDIYERK